MMSNTTTMSGAPLATTTTTGLHTAPAAGLVSSHPLTTTGLPLTSAPHDGLTNVNNANTFTHSGITPLPGTDAMIRPVESHITLPAPVMAPGQPAALLHGGSTTTTIGGMGGLNTQLAHTHIGEHHHQHGTTGLATGAPLMHDSHMHAGSHHHTTGAPLMTGAPLTTGAPLMTGAPLAAGMPLQQTTTTHSVTGVQPIATTTTTTGAHHGGLLHHDAHHDATTDKHLLKEREKESHRLAKEQEKLAKERAKEQHKHEKEEEKLHKKQEKEHLKHEKELEKEHKKHEKELLKAEKHGHHGTTTHTTGDHHLKHGMTGTTVQPTVLPAGAVVLPTYAGSGLPVAAAGQGYGNPLLTDAQAAAVEIAKANHLHGAPTQPMLGQPLAGQHLVGTTPGYTTGAPLMTGAPITTTTTTYTQPSAMHTAPRL